MAGYSIPLASQLSPPPCVLADSSHILLVMTAAGKVRLLLGGMGGTASPVSCDGQGSLVSSSCRGNCSLRRRIQK